MPVKNAVGRTDTQQQSLDFPVQVWDGLGLLGALVKELRADPLVKRAVLVQVALDDALQPPQGIVVEPGLRARSRFEAVPQPRGGIEGLIPTHR